MTENYSFAGIAGRQCHRQAAVFVIDPSQLEIQVAKIRTEVARRGGFTVDCGWLRLLYPDDLAENQRFAHIAALAQREGWSFAFLLDGSVHFAAYPATITSSRNHE